MTESQKSLPSGLKHIAIIMDGNGRWAKRRSKSRIFGHRKGSENVRTIATACSELGLDILSLFAFSTENWNRPKREVTALMNLFATYLKSERKTVLDNNMQFKITGEFDRFPRRVRKFAVELIEESESNTGMILNLAVSYGGRQEIVESVRKVCRDVAEGRISETDITVDSFKRYLWTSDLPDPDLLIRTSGEFRISNFMIWQIAYSEIYITDVLWPDFTKAELLKAIATFATRHRRFGKVVG